ncbi:dihydrofolate reductase [Treponema ruminis]|jgi:phosphoglycerate dehydrogenase-like enzyme|uniref:NAD(P)-dependent oxidoreductase n=1 Tax=Treponema ruminis TaxID=744515 RepID=UPI00197E6F77|nr:NAD(P)-dependent oxidoreductase [Treponema ruminis]MCI6673816.1 hypothetical protein [Spirochaetaceae bacterium]QSI03347.1 dihydrofolate reductase [Treponema ruminis]
MRKFEKLVEVGPVGLTAWAEKELETYARQVIRHDTLPADDADLVRRIGDADALLTRTLPVIGADVLSAAPRLKYVGMCCSLYSKESANVDIGYAETHGITVTGIRDYGDHGVTEYVIYQLVRILHGYDYPRWKALPLEITGLKVGFVGMGASGTMTAQALQMLGAEIHYFARSVKPEREAEGMRFQPLDELLAWCDVVVTCLNKNVVLLHEKQFEALGEGKIMCNTSIGPASDMDALKRWIDNPRNIFCSDTKGGIGPIADMVMGRENVICPDASAGMTSQAYDLLGRKVLDNIRNFLGQE